MVWHLSSEQPILRKLIVPITLGIKHINPDDPLDCDLKANSVIIRAQAITSDGLQGLAAAMEDNQKEFMTAVPSSSMKVLLIILYPT